MPTSMVQYGAILSGFGTTFWRISEELCGFHWVKLSTFTPRNWKGKKWLVMTILQKSNGHYFAYHIGQTRPSLDAVTNPIPQSWYNQQLVPKMLFLYQWDAIVACNPCHDTPEKTRGFNQRIGMFFGEDVRIDRGRKWINHSFPFSHQILRKTLHSFPLSRPESTQRPYCFVDAFGGNIPTRKAIWFGKGEGQPVANQHAIPRASSPSLVATSCAWHVGSTAIFAIRNCQPSLSQAMSQIIQVAYPEFIKYKLRGKLVTSACLEVVRNCSTKGFCFLLKMLKSGLQLQT